MIHMITYKNKILKFFCMAIWYMFTKRTLALMKHLLAKE